MNKAIHFRVLLDFDENVFRDIEVQKDDTFLTLHMIIQEAFGFDNSQMASFYVSNEEWEKGQEITLMDMAAPDEGGEPIWLMHETPLSKIVFERDQKLLYVFDFMLMWCFYIDVIGLEDYPETVILPRIRQSYGEAPDQYSKDTDLSFEGTEAERIRLNNQEEEDEVNELFRVMSDEGMFDESDY